MEKDNLMYMCNLKNKWTNKVKQTYTMKKWVFSRGVKLGEIGEGIKRHKFPVINKPRGYDIEHKEYDQ